MINGTSSTALDRDVEPAPATNVGLEFTNLRDLSKKPKEFKQRLDEIKNQLQTQLQERRKQAESQANLEALKQWLRIGIQSMLLSICYSLIGWLGIRELSSMKKRTA